MNGLLKEHSGKAATLAGGGFSLGVAVMMFVGKAEFAMLRDDVRELNREFREHEMSHLRASVETNEVFLAFQP